MSYKYQINRRDNGAKCLINSRVICLISCVDDLFRTKNQIIPLKVYHNRVRVNPMLTSRGRVQLLRVISTMVLL